MRYLIIIIALFTASQLQAQKVQFITTDGIHLIDHDKPYYFIGTNAWYFVNIASAGEGGDRDRLIDELDQLQELGVTNLRITAGTEGPETEPWRIHPAIQPKPKQYNEDILKGMDFLLDEMGKRNMKAVMCMNNFFMWSGGMAQYVSWAEGTEIPYPQDQKASWDEYQAYSARFYTNEKAMSLFNDFLRKIITRKNTINGQKYTEDPTIMSWQLANEPRGRQNIVEYVIWANNTAKLIKSLDQNHLVSLGGEGLLPDDGMDTGFKVISQSKYIDYLTMHLWIENWGWYRPAEPDSTFKPAMEKAERYITEHIKLANRINKPLVLEEFGISRDMGVFDPHAATGYRQIYFKYIFDKVIKSARENDALAGCNFWSWAGTGEADTPGEFWSKGDEFIGDPPHEIQGWYSVHSHDKETLGLIEKKVNELGKATETKKK